MSVLKALAQSLMDVGRVSESLEFYQECLRLRPWDPANCELPAKCCDGLSHRCLFLQDLAETLYTKSFQIRTPISSFVFDSIHSVKGQLALVSLLHCLQCGTVAFFSIARR